MRVAIFGAGLVGRRTARLLVAAGFEHVVLVSQTRTAPPIAGVISVTGWPHRAASDVDVVVLATASNHQFVVANGLVSQGTTVISTADNPIEVARLWELDAVAKESGAMLVVGAAYSPGLSTAMAAHLVAGFDQVTAISTAQFGTGGPACAREHHRAMSAPSREVHRGLLRESRGGTGRELVWFPDPVGAADCYRAGLADPFLLHQAFPGVRRIESRQAATRRDRLTARLPMLRPPHIEGLIGAVWAEVRGVQSGRVEHRVMAATGAQATGTAAVASGLCQIVQNEGMRPGTQSAATAGSSTRLLQVVSKDVVLWTYDQSHVSTNFGQGSENTARKWPKSREK